MLRDELIVVSDVHIKSMDQKRALVLLKVLEEIDVSSVKYLVLLGDIFDFFVGGHPYFIEKFKPLWLKLGELSESVTVLFFQGNHEFSLERWDFAQIEFVTRKDHRIFLLPNSKILLAHGDQVHNSDFYFFYFKIIRSRLFSFLLSLIPGAFLDKVSLFFSGLSYKKNKTRKIEHRNILHSAEKWLEGESVDYGIIGHFHVPYSLSFHHLENKPAFFGLCNWDHPNILSYDQGTFYRTYFSEDGDETEKHALKMS